MVAPDLHDEATAAYEARKELGPEYERAVLESFVASATESIDQRVDARLAQQGIGGTPQKQQGQQPDNSHLAVPVFSLLFGGAPRATFTDLPRRSGIFSPASVGSFWSFAGQVSSSLTAPRSISVSVGRRPGSGV